MPCWLDQGDRGERQQPADLGADLLVEHPPQARSAAEATAAEAAATAARPVLGPGQAAEAVVAEDQVPDRAVRAAADVRPRGRRPERHGERPRRADGDHREAGEHELADPDEQPRRAGEEIRRRERGHDHPALQHLRHEREADDGAAPDEELRPPGLDRPDEQPGRRDEQEDE
jgi:hypothetical protein